MRREELESRDPELFAELAARCEVGYLGLVTADGTPRVVPLNFAAVGQDIYFHGALAGEKFELLRVAPRGLQALMEKYQPEGQFTPIAADNPLYGKALRTVGVFRVAVENWTGKVKFGVNETEATRRKLIAGLRERGEPRDLETALEIEKTFGS